MEHRTVDAALFKEMMTAAAAVLDKNKAVLNDLNVFPVPDGDTGTNMSMTMMSAIKELKSNDAKSVGAAAQDMSMGALRGARGNSGVILSQLFRGFARRLSGVTEMSAMEFAEAVKMGVDAAYKAVMRPKEGTILTVARVSAEDGLKAARSGKSVNEVIKAILESAESILKKTPDMLPVLKESGVVDAGGKGLIYIYTGYKIALDGDVSELETMDIAEGIGGEASAVSSVGLESIEFTYCTEFFVKNLKNPLTEQTIDWLRDRLERLGDSIVVVGDGDLIKVHVHSNAPGLVLQNGLRLGEISSVKIDNMKEQHRSILDGGDTEKPKPEEPKKEYAIIAVANGSGIKAIFNDLMVDGIIEGGQTMNPSIEDIAKEIERINAEKIFILPNNKNIILASEQAAELAQDKIVRIIPTKSIPQGIAAVLAFSADASLDENEENMNEAISQVKSGQVTFAVRDSQINGTKIREGDIIGLNNGAIEVVGTDVTDVSKKLLAKMIDSQTDIVTIFYGEDVSKEAAEKFAASLEEEYPDCSFALHSGQQPLYYYIFSVE